MRFFVFISIFFLKLLRKAYDAALEACFAQISVMIPWSISEH